MWLVVVNPKAGLGAAAKLATQVVGFLKSNEINYRMISPNSAQETKAQVREALRAGEATKLLSVGGDGLFHLLLQLAIEFKVPLALAPGGTGNDFYRTLGWFEYELSVYLEHLISVEPTLVDVGVVDGEYFGAVLSSGFDSVVNERANRMKWPTGPAKYNAAIALELPKFQAIEFKIFADEKVMEVEAMLIAIGNGNSYGGGMKVCPDADLQDGLLDIMILHPVSKLEFIKVFPTVYKGTHIEHPQVEVIRAKAIRIESSAVAYADGERIGQLPVQVESLPKTLLTWPA
ncbi:LCB5 Sphingosine kinase and enzymes related to eukaryotic diacylglycerol kinase [Candidatus Nanopelagicaceae bacterium]